MMANPLQSVADLRMSEGHELSKDVIRAHVRIIEDALASPGNAYTPGEAQHNELLFGAALGNYRLQEYRKARSHAMMLVNLDPTNSNAQDLLASIKEAINRDGKVGLAIVGGLAVGAAALIAMLKK
eukprot:m.41604 g.41604  ORF g.41604 m.41604 type:complete len:126 (+) comp14943_c0_seq1:292-669(+)